MLHISNFSLSSALLPLECTGHRRKWGCFTAPTEPHSWWADTHYLPQVDSSLLCCGLRSHLILQTSSIQLPCISDWIRSQYNWYYRDYSFWVFKIQRSHAYQETPAAHSYVLTTTYLCHRAFCSSLQLLFISTRIRPAFFTHHWKASFVFMRTCTSASHLLPSFPVSGQVSDFITWSNVSIPGWVKLPLIVRLLLCTLCSSLNCATALPSPGHPPSFRPPESLLSSLWFSIDPHFLIKRCIFVLC